MMRGILGAILIVLGGLGDGVGRTASAGRLNGGLAAGKILGERVGYLV